MNHQQIYKIKEYAEKLQQLCDGEAIPFHKTSGKGHRESCERDAIQAGEIKYKAQGDYYKKIHDVLGDLSEDWIYIVRIFEDLRPAWFSRVDSMRKAILTHTIPNCKADNWLESQTHNGKLMLSPNEHLKSEIELLANEFLQEVKTGSEKELTKAGGEEVSEPNTEAAKQTFAAKTLVKLVKKCEQLERLAPYLRCVGFSDKVRYRSKDAQALVEEIDMDLAEVCEQHIKPYIGYDDEYSCLSDLGLTGTYYGNDLYGGLRWALTRSGTPDSIHTVVLFLKKVLQNVERKAEVSITTANEPYIKKGQKVWEFGFHNKSVSVDAVLMGLPLIEFLLLNRGEEYTPLELLKETGLRREGETEPEPIYSDKDIKMIKAAIKRLKGRAKSTQNLQEKENLEEEIEKSEKELHKTRNFRGKSRKISEKHRLSVLRVIETVLKKISTETPELYNHLNTFLKRGEICSYKPDSEIIWDISKEPF